MHGSAACYYNTVVFNVKAMPQIHCQLVTFWDLYGLNIIWGTGDSVMSAQELCHQNVHKIQLAWVARRPYGTVKMRNGVLPVKPTFWLSWDLDPC